MSLTNLVAVIAAAAIAAIVLGLIDRHEEKPPIETQRVSEEQKERLRRKVEDIKRRRRQGRPPWH